MSRSACCQHDDREEIEAVQSYRYFTPEQISSLDHKKIPHHVAIIPDGNRRWAKKQHAPREEGHREGADIIIETMKAAKEIGIKIISFFLFSTENWERSQDEVHALMWLLETFMIEQRQTMIDDGIRMETIGDLSRLPVSVQNAIQDTKAATSHCKCIDMVLALNYGSRDEIRRAVQSIAEDVSQNKIRKEDITENLISRYLDTAQWAEPDLFIRTSGEKRLSNFLLWQLSYAELYIAEVLWPDFRSGHLLEALINFQKRERRLGGA